MRSSDMTQVASVQCLIDRTATATHFLTSNRSLFVLFASTQLQDAVPLMEFQAICATTVT